MKECFKCKETKPLSCFYKHSQMADGHLNKCKECAKNDTKENRAENIEYYKEYDRNRPNHDERVKKRCEKVKQMYSQDEVYKNKILESKTHWIERNKHKRQAQVACGNAVRDGRLPKPSSCKHCGVSGVKIQYHHHSYEKEFWLDVIPLCTKCHGLEHRRLNEIERKQSFSN